MSGVSPIGGHATPGHDAAHWHVLQREGGLSPQQQAQFMDWLVASPQHLREYLAVQRAAGELADVLRDADIDLEALLRPPGDNVVVLPVPARPVGTPAPRRRGLRAAALAAGLAGVALLLHALWPREQIHSAAAGAPRLLVLADGSRVHLAGASTLVARFGPLQRRVELRQGQASFEIAGDLRPFEVHAAGLRIEDIGTVFDVSLLRDRARVDVARGRVKVWASDAAGGAPLADLRAGQRARIAYADHATRLSHEDPRDMTAWWSGRVVFRDEPLLEVAERFNRLNRMQLRIDDDAAAALRLTGNLRGDDIASLLAYLRDQPALAVRRDGMRLHVGSRAAQTPALR